MLSSFIQSAQSMAGTLISALGKASAPSGVLSPRIWSPCMCEIRTGRKAAEPALDDVLERHIVVASGARRVEARIMLQFWHVHRLDHLLPLIRHQHDRDE